jgi:hypothetical protein
MRKSSPRITNGLDRERKVSNQDFFGCNSQPLLPESMKDDRVDKFTKFNISLSNQHFVTNKFTKTGTTTNQVIKNQPENIIHERTSLLTAFSVDSHDKRGYSRIDDPFNDSVLSNLISVINQDVMYKQ